MAKNKSISFEKRYALNVVLNQCNVVVSHVQDWDLNFLFFECLYLGVPLIHNSEFLKDYGYYYPKCNAKIAAEHLRTLKEEPFDRQIYINRNKELLYKYSMDNPRNMEFFEKRLKDHKKIDVKDGEINEDQSHTTIISES
jgi:hypothetical protein